MTCTVEAMLASARKYLGYVEKENNDTIFGKRFGMNHQPWCDMSVCCIGEDVKARDIVGWFAYTPSHANWFKARKQWGTTPKVGAIVFFQWPGMGRIAHVGIVEAIRPDGSIVTLEGNTDAAGGRTGGRYMRKVRSANIAGYGYPAYAKSVPAKKAPAKKATPAKKTQPRPPARPTLKRGDKGAYVKDLQRRLHLMADGDFGPRTEWTVKSFQKKVGLTADGIVGPATWKALG